MSDIKKIKPSLSKGTRDFLPREVAKRNYIFDTIKSVFRKYGFEEIETPAIEKLETLTGKYGEEGDKLLFKILNSGDPFKELEKQDILYLMSRIPDLRTQIIEEENLDSDEDYDKNFTAELVNKKLSNVAGKMIEKGLRYDLTVPLARYVVQHQNKLAFPFKRFHIGPVWRADRPQKGRYQEFYQCDADIIGSTSLVNESELTQIYLEVFAKLGFVTLVTINHRLLLEEIAKWIGAKENPMAFITTIDKLHKIKLVGVKAELKEKGIHFDPDKLESFVANASPQMDNEQLLRWVVKELGISENAASVSHLSKIIKSVKQYPKARLCFDPLLARGLDYYTGVIWEANAGVNDWPGAPYDPSLGGGGRYDNLTEMFGGQNMSGVGISFGIERIYDVMQELNLFPETIAQGVKVLFVPRDETVEEFAFEQAQALRDAGISAEIYLGNVKKQKHFKYVEDKNIAYLVEVGGNEKESQLFRLRNAKTRDTADNLTITDIIERVK